MAKKNDYFLFLKEQISYSTQAGEMLLDSLKNFNKNDICSLRENIHQIERLADEKRHEISSKLSKEFITPVDQEDIVSLCQQIDDVTDAIDEVALEVYMFNVTKIPEMAVELCEVMLSCVKTTSLAVEESKNFKKPEKLYTILREVNALETKADKIYIEALRRLFSSELTSKELFGYKAIYDCLENCCDLCSKVADVIEQIALKNA